jgi:S-DNA-T family DNA segregation ATPase FtsK/SpoIIIE
MRAPAFLPSAMLPEPTARGARKAATPAAARRSREVRALLLCASAVFVLLALVSFEESLEGPGNWAGGVGHGLVALLVDAVGVMAWLAPVELLLVARPLLRPVPTMPLGLRVGGDVLLAIVAASLVQVIAPEAVVFGVHGAAGAVGEVFGELARALFSTAGSVLVGLSILGLLLIARTGFSFIAFADRVTALAALVAHKLGELVRRLRAAWAESKALAEEAPHVTTASDEAIVVVEREPAEHAAHAAHAAPTGPTIVETQAVADLAVAKIAAAAEDPAAIEAVEAEAVERKAKRRSRKKKVAAALEETADAAIEQALCDEPEGDAEACTLHVEEEEADDEAAPTIVDTSSALEVEVARPRTQLPLFVPEKKPFELPSLDLLATSKSNEMQFDKDALIRNADLLVKTLGDFKVTGKVEDILPGPTVTTYEFSPDAGTKVSKVAGLVDDLALALARKVRIVAPIPGKNRIGFELPNEKRMPVSLRDLVEDRRFQGLDAPLPVVLGRDIVGHPLYADLASMPHVIVAGATGAGKSVGLNVMLTSLLYRRSPEQVRLLMIDPKVVELAPFDRIPHMLLPVVTDMKQASLALKWAVDEMERRYQAFSDAGTKNISTFNNWCDRVARGDAPNPNKKVVVGIDHNGLPDEATPLDDQQGVAPLPEKMAHIVVVVDEFADLMMQQGKEVETCIARLAQKARAAGMHVILATQRPSVDVITGMIKANFPTRIAFRVSQKVDSRTILDEQGAEHLLGKGDMLVKLNGTNDTKRVQCPWVSEEEVQAITDHLRTQGEPVYDENILKPRDEDGEEDEGDADDETDSMYAEAVQIVLQSRRCSTSWLQRKLGLGYNRAARIVECMERRGVVGPANGTKDREILLSS